MSNALTRLKRLKVDTEEKFVLLYRCLSVISADFGWEDDAHDQKWFCAKIGSVVVAKKMLDFVARGLTQKSPWSKCWSSNRRIYDHR